MSLIQHRNQCYTICLSPTLSLLPNLVNTLMYLLPHNPMDCRTDHVAERISCLYFGIKEIMPVTTIPAKFPCRVFCWKRIRKPNQNSQAQKARKFPSRHQQHCRTDHVAERISCLYFGIKEIMPVTTIPAKFPCRVFCWKRIRKPNQNSQAQKARKFPSRHQQRYTRP